MANTPVYDWPWEEHAEDCVNYEPPEGATQKEN